MIDFAIGVGFPILIMALRESYILLSSSWPNFPVDYIVQGHRFDIYEGFGPWPSIVNMWPSYIIIWMWPIIIGLISFTYSGNSCVFVLIVFQVLTVTKRDPYISSFGVVWSSSNTCLRTGLECL